MYVCWILAIHKIAGRNVQGNRRAAYGRFSFDYDPLQTWEWFIFPCAGPLLCKLFVFACAFENALSFSNTSHAGTQARGHAGTHTSAPPDCPPANGAQRPKHCNGNADAPRPAASERAHAQGLGRPQGGGGRAAPPRSRTDPCLLRVSSRPLSLRRIRHVSLRSQLILDLFLYNNISELIWDLSLSLFLFLSIVSPCARGYGERERSQVRGREREKCLRIKTYVHIYPLHKDEQRAHVLSS